MHIKVTICILEVQVIKVEWTGKEVKEIWIHRLMCLNNPLFFKSLTIIGAKKLVETLLVTSRLE